jgi:hypothetical protein
MRRGLRNERTRSLARRRPLGRSVLRQRRAAEVGATRGPQWLRWPAHGLRILVAHTDTRDSRTNAHQPATGLRAFGTVRRCAWRGRVPGRPTAAALTFAAVAAPAATVRT